VKILETEFVANQDLVLRCLNQALAVHAIHHPNIVDTIDGIPGRREPRVATATGRPTASVRDGEAYAADGFGTGGGARAGHRSPVKRQKTLRQ
jgi:hypothetical protein